jgi:hypothetical protein
MKQTHQKISRRTFVRSAAAVVAVPYIVSSSALGGDGRPAASSRLTMGLIGLGSMGMRHVKGFLQEDDCRIIAVCDVDAARRNAAAEEVNKQYGNKDCARYNDFRELLGRDDIDTLCISVPDHWHSITAMMGIVAGKDIYGEKPLSLTISEGRAMVEAAHRYKCVWQTGSWQRATAHFRFGCELVRNKRIGEVQRVEVGIGGGYKPAGGQPAVNRIDPQPVMSVPDGFDYEMWLGPAPWAPYTEKRCHWTFRWILDYSGGHGFWITPAAKSPTGVPTTSTSHIGAWAVTRPGRSKLLATVYSAKTDYGTRQLTTILDARMTTAWQCTSQVTIIILRVSGS